MVDRKTLRKRLSNRGPDEFGGEVEIQNWMFSWEGWWEEKMKKKGAVPIDAARPVDDIVKEIISIIRVN